MKNFINRARLAQGLTETAIVGSFIVGYLLLLIGGFGALVMVMNRADVASAVALVAYTTLMVWGLVSEKNVPPVFASVLGYIVPFLAIPLGLTRFGFGVPIYFACLGLAFVVVPTIALVVCKVLFTGLARLCGKVSA